MEPVKFVILKHSGREILHLEPFVAFFSTTYMLRSLFVKIFQQNMSLNQRNLRGVPMGLKLNNLDLSGNTTEFKTLPTRPRHSKGMNSRATPLNFVCPRVSHYACY